MSSDKPQASTHPAQMHQHHKQGQTLEKAIAAITARSSHKYLFT
ncbi:hypothetical protein [Tolypothrix sp. FACHB-123]|nr:hypothetical protein [Tolypothrix sp. FACHB-123]